MTVIVDDHLLRDWMARPDDSLVEAIAGQTVACTNLWYTRLCKSAARATGGALPRGWKVAQRRALIAGLVALPDEVVVVPMRELAWRMGELSAEHNGLSTLGAEVIAAALDLDARILVYSRDDGAGVRRCAAALGVTSDSLTR